MFPKIEALALVAGLESFTSFSSGSSCSSSSDEDELDDELEEDPDEDDDELDPEELESDEDSSSSSSSELSFSSVFSWLLLGSEVAMGGGVTSDLPSALPALAAKTAGISEIVLSPSSSTVTFTHFGSLALLMATVPEGQVRSLTQFYYVDFSQSRVGVKKCVFNKRTIKVCVSCC